MTHELPTTPPLLEWHAHQTEHHTHGVLWYSIAGLVVAGSLLYSVWTHAWTFTFVIVLVSVLYQIAHRKVPSEKHMRIWANGFALEDEFTPWQDCKRYWITKSRTSTTLTIEPKKTYLPSTKMQLGTINPQVIHELFDPYIQESVNRGENLIDTIIHICKL